MSDIVVGVDGSEGSVAALRWAVRDAELRGVGVRAVLAWAPGGRPPEVDAVTRSPYLDDLAFAASKVLHRVVDSVETEVDAGGTLVKVVERIVHSMPAHALLDESLDAQMLVVGSRHLPPTGRVVIGSVGEVCAHQACVPVVVIRGRVDGADDRRPVVVGVDGSVASLSALRWAAVEARLRKAPLHVVHVGMATPGAAGSSVPGTAAAHKKRPAREVLEYCLAECRAETECLDVQPGVADGGTAASLVEAAEGAQLLVVGARGFGGFAGLLLGSTSHYCVTRARCPVAVVRGPRGDQM